MDRLDGVETIVEMLGQLGTSSFAFESIQSKKRKLPQLNMIITFSFNWWHPSSQFLWPHRVNILPTNFNGPSQENWKQQTWTYLFCGYNWATHSLQSLQRLWNGISKLYRFLTFRKIHLLYRIAMPVQQSSYQNPSPDFLSFHFGMLANERKWN